MRIGKRKYFEAEVGHLSLFYAALISSKINGQREEEGEPLCLRKNFMTFSLLFYVKSICVRKAH
jgi:hypothetical protein